VQASRHWFHNKAGLMKSRTRNWLTATILLLALGTAGLYVVSSVLSKRFEPHIRDLAISYLRNRFDSEVELESLRIHIPKLSPFRLLLRGGRGSVAHVEGANLRMRHRGRRDIPAMFALKRFSFEMDLGALSDTPRTVNRITLDGMEIYIPPKGERPSLGSGKNRDTPPAIQAEADTTGSVVIEEIVARNAVLVVLPRDKSKIPLRFDIQDLRLTSAGKDVAMKYDAALRNPKPPGNIHSVGTFGPWVTEEPGDTPLSGNYVLDKADLSVFTGIVGILASKGQFKGSLSSVTARGQASVPDFGLKRSGNRVPLSTTFEVLVDGTNGNTLLKPVHATLGKSSFTTSGGVIKHDGDEHRTIGLDVKMPNGNLVDLLRLAMKGPPFMEGRIFLNTKIAIPPLLGKVREKLLLDGQFKVSEGKFRRSKIQDQIDGLSRRGQGQPKNEEIDEVVSLMTGDFKLSDEMITFHTLSFGVPGAAISLAGDYDLAADALDFRGALKLEAKVSQTMSGWKRWALRPVDPFFAKNGAGTFLRIKVVGTSREPKFGLDRGKAEGVDTKARETSAPK
jgi:hypothetical protein